MPYEQAQKVRVGDKVRNVTGREAEVIGRRDSGLSVIFHVYTNGSAFDVHSDKCWPVDG